MAANYALKTSAEHSYFYIFKSPTIIMPSFGIFRRLIFNPSSRFIYRKNFEEKFTKEKFMNGAIQVF